MSVVLTVCSHCEVLTNNPNIFSNIRVQARSYLQKADKTTITTSDRGGRITDKMVEGLEETRKGLLSLLEGDKLFGCLRLPNKGKLFCVTCNSQSYSKAGVCKIRNGPKNESFDIGKDNINTILIRFFQWKSFTSQFNHEKQSLH